MITTIIIISYLTNKMNLEIRSGIKHAISSDYLDLFKFFEEHLNMIQIIIDVFIMALDHNAIKINDYLVENYFDFIDKKIIEKSLTCRQEIVEIFVRNGISYQEYLCDLSFCSSDAIQVLLKNNYDIDPTIALSKIVNSGKINMSNIMKMIELGANVSECSFNESVLLSNTAP